MVFRAISRFSKLMTGSPSPVATRRPLPEGEADEEPLSLRERGWGEGQHGSAALNYLQVNKSPSQTQPAMSEKGELK
jgi:hypothetical protein